MTFVVDIGNTNVVCGVYKDSVLIWHSRFKTDKISTSDEYYASLSSLQQGFWRTDNIDNVVIASVVPDMTRKWQHLFRKHFSLEAMIVNGDSPLGLSFVVPNPAFIGADLVANALSAWKKYKANCLIIDFGTATTLQIVSSDGLFLGAIIAPGMLTAASELFEHAALLSDIELSNPGVLLGTNTKEAMLSGIIKGHALMIQGFVTELEKEFPALLPFIIIATGGISEFLAPMIKSVQIVDRTLTLDGLFYASGILKETNRI